MTFTEGCPSGRSQDLTYVSEEIVTLDRKTLEEIFSLIGDCVDTIINLRHSIGDKLRRAIARQEGLSQQAQTCETQTGEVI